MIREQDPLLSDSELDSRIRRAYSAAYYPEHVVERALATRTARRSRTPLRSSRPSFIVAVAVAAAAIVAIGTPTILAMTDGGADEGVPTSADRSPWPAPDEIDTSSADGKAAAVYAKLFSRGIPGGLVYVSVDDSSRRVVVAGGEGFRGAVESAASDFVESAFGYELVFDSSGLSANLESATVSNEVLTRVLSSAVSAYDGSAGSSVVDGSISAQTNSVTIWRSGRDEAADESAASAGSTAGVEVQILPAIWDEGRTDELKVAIDDIVGPQSASDFDVSAMDTTPVGAIVYVTGNFEIATEALGSRPGVLRVDLDPNEEESFGDAISPG